MSGVQGEHIFIKSFLLKTTGEVYECGDSEPKQQSCMPDNKSTALQYLVGNRRMEAEFCPRVTSFTLHCHWIRCSCIKYVLVQI